MSENEPFVDAEIGAKFLSVSRRLLELARSGQVPGHPIGRGTRKRWRVSENLEPVRSHACARSAGGRPPVTS
jgi:hypothetical protein